MIVLDTSVLVDSFCGTKRTGPLLRDAIEEGERLGVPSLVLYEWLRGPRTPEELAIQEFLFPPDASLAFGYEEAEVAALLYQTVSRSRGREVDIAIAASALVRDALLWTLNPKDFRDFPGLRVSPPGSEL